MKAKDAMTPHVMATSPDATVAEVARMLLTRQISGVPVIESERLVGIVTEGDLIRRVEIGTSDQRRSWWLRLFLDNAQLATEYVRPMAPRLGTS